MKYRYLIYLLIICSLFGSGCISEVVLKKNTIVPYTDTITLSGTISGASVALTGSSVIKERASSKMEQDAGKPNYRQPVWIRQIVDNFVNLLKCWFWDLLIVTLLIAVLTEMLGNFIRPYGIKIPKLLWSVSLAGISALFYRLFMASGWTYAIALNGLACFTANIGWHYFVNLLKIQRVVGLFRKRQHP